jgi:hypothetical protein
MPEGFNRRILHVDLTTGSLQVETPHESFYRKYLGGSAMGLYYILKAMKPGADAFAPENVLTLMVSILTGAPISGQSRMCANARSPLVDGIGDSQCGGFFPAEMRFAGFDGVVVAGNRILVSSTTDSTVSNYETGKGVRLITGVPGAADIGYDAKRNRVLIPVVSGNRVEIWQLP